MIPQTFTVTSEHIRFYFLLFSVLHFLVVGSVRLSVRARVKIASRIVSYRFMRHPVFCVTTKCVLQPV